MNNAGIRDSALVLYISMNVVIHLWKNSNYSVSSHSLLTRMKHEAVLICEIDKQ